MTDPTRPGEAQAVRAALSDPAVVRHGDDDLREFQKIVAAAYPAIEAAGYERGREQAAQEIRAVIPGVHARISQERGCGIAQEVGRAMGLAWGADIARGGR